jgi:site-specific recombinase XerD
VPGAVCLPGAGRLAALKPFLRYATGLRVSELVKMRLRDVNFDAGYLITFGKGRKERLVPVGEQALASVRAYVEGARAEILRGKALDTDDPKMRALEAYILAQRTGKTLQYGKH